MKKLYWAKISKGGVGHTPIVNLAPGGTKGPPKFSMAKEANKTQEHHLQDVLYRLTTTEILRIIL